MHLTFELMDRFFFQSKLNSFSDRVLSLYSTTCFLIASKYDEVDDRLVFISDVQNYFASPVSLATNGKVIIPQWKDIIECER